MKSNLLMPAGSAHDVHLWQINDHILSSAATISGGKWILQGSDRLRLASKWPFKFMRALARLGSIGLRPCGGDMPTIHAADFAAGWRKVHVL